MTVGNIDRENSDDRFITGIAGRKNFTIITLQKHDNAYEPHAPSGAGGL